MGVSISYSVPDAIYKSIKLETHQTVIRLSE